MARINKPVKKWNAEYCTSMQSVIHCINNILEKYCSPATEINQPLRKASFKPSLAPDPIRHNCPGL